MNRAILLMRGSGNPGRWEARPGGTPGGARWGRPVWAYPGEGFGCEWGSESSRSPSPLPIVGRHLGMDVPVDGLDVSQRHAYFHSIGGRLFCVDLGSRSGTHWPEGPFTWGWVGSGCKVRIGHHTVGPDPGDGEAGLDAVEPPMPTSRSFASFTEPAALCVLRESRHSSGLAGQPGACPHRAVPVLQGAALPVATFQGPCSRCPGWQRGLDH